MKAFEWLTDHFVEVLIIGVCLMFLSLGAEIKAENDRERDEPTTMYSEELIFVNHATEGSGI